MSAPTDLIATSEASRVHLSWNYNTYATGYNIYVAHGDSDLEYLDATERNYFITDKLTAGDTYTFRVEPYYVLGNNKEARGTYTTCEIEVSKAEGKNNAATAAGSGTYIEISISQQHLWYYENNELYLDTDVVTGNNDGECNVLRQLLAGLQRRYRNPRRELALVLRRHYLQRQRLSRLRQHAL